MSSNIAEAIEEQNEWGDIQGDSITVKPKAKTIEQRFLK